VALRGLFDLDHPGAPHGDAVAGGRRGTFHRTRIPLK
jgi:hypothetical protein